MPVCTTKSQPHLLRVAWRGLLVFGVRCWRGRWGKMKYRTKAAAIIIHLALVFPLRRLKHPAVLHHFDYVKSRRNPRARFQSRTLGQLISDNPYSRQRAAAAAAEPVDVRSRWRGVLPRETVPAVCSTAKPMPACEALKLPREAKDW